jgi:hypothetical protein
MTRETIQEEKWRSLFQEQHARLVLAIETLLYRNESPEQILRAALTELEGRPFHEFFGQVSALRAVVKAAIAHNYTLFAPQIASSLPVSVNDENMAAPFLAALPWSERAVYFLSEILHYARRDTALLLGISDSNVDQLIRFAKKLIASRADAFVSLQSPESSYPRVVDSRRSMTFSSFE